MLKKELQALIKACTSAKSQEFKAFLQTVELKYANLTENQALPQDDFIASLPNVLLIELELPLLTQLKAYLWPLNWENAGGIAITECGSSVSQTQPNSVPIVYLALVILKNIVSYLTDDQNSANLKLVSKKFYYAISGNLHILAPRFLQTVTWGKQASVETMIENYPALLTMKAHYIDHAGRKIYCTGYQRAVWDGDWYMFQMMEKYLLDSEITKQREELANRGLGQYGSYFNFIPILNSYIPYFDATRAMWARPSEDGPLIPSGDESQKLYDSWKRISAQQALLPIHVIQQFCHPARNFTREKTPDFNEPQLPRRIYYEKDSNHDGCILGVDVGLTRGGWSNAAARAKWGFGWCYMVEGDYLALKKLSAVVEQHRAAPIARNIPQIQSLLPAIQSDTFPTLLRYTVNGDQRSAEKFLENCPQSLFFYNEITDSAQRKIMCTAIQYAVWAGDWYLYKKFFKAMYTLDAVHVVKEQIRSLNHLGLGGDHQYPARFNFNPVLAAYSQYIATPSAHLWLLLAKEQAALPIFILQKLLQSEHAFNYNRETYYERQFDRNTQLENGTDMLDENSRRDFGVRYGLFRHHDKFLSSTENPTDNVLEDIKRDLTCLQQLASCVKKIEHHFAYPRGLPI